MIGLRGVTDKRMSAWGLGSSARGKGSSSRAAVSCWVNTDHLEADVKAPIWVPSNPVKCTVAIFFVCHLGARLLQSPPPQHPAAASSPQRTLCTLARLLLAWPT